MGGKQIFALILALFLVPSILHADEWDCTQPDIKLCLDLAETDGSVAIDRSREGDTGTLNGGPARVLAQPITLNQYSTTTFAMFLPHYINFTRTVGEDVTCALDAGLNLSAKPFMLAFTFSMDSNIAVSRSIWNYATGDVSLGGWDFRIDGADQLNFGVIGLADELFTTRVYDFKPHAISTWVDGAGTIVLYFDGKKDRRITGQPNIASILGQIAIARRVAAGHGEFGGGFGKARLKVNVTSEAQADALALSYYNGTFGRNNQ